MAVSNAIGSNVFDINLGLGLPFLIRICIEGGKPFMLLNEEKFVRHMFITLSIATSTLNLQWNPAIQSGPLK